MINTDNIENISIYYIIMMKNFLTDDSTVEFSGDYLVQELWQGILKNSVTIADSYSLQYFKYELNSELVLNPEFIKQKIHEYGIKFYHSLDVVYKQYECLEGVVIPFDVIYDSEQESIFIYFVLPSEFQDIFSSEEEWSFKSSEVPANTNIKMDTKKEIEGVLD